MSDQSHVDVLPAEVLPAQAPEVAGPAEQAPAAQRFHTCRWHKSAETGTSAHCTHRDVLPMAGTAGFAAEAWCLECGHYKVRRTVRKTAYS
jgi:hypothetical protein